MIKSNQRFLKALNALSDGILVLLSYLFSSWFWLDVLKSDRNMAAISNLSAGTGVAALIYAITLVVLFALFKLYNPSRVRRIRMDIAAAFEANALGIVIVGALLFLFRLEDFSRGVLLIFFFTSSCSVSAKHVLLHSLAFHIRQKGFNQKHVLVVGGKKLARQYIQDALSERKLGIHVIGYLSDALSPEINATHLGTFESLSSHLKDTGVDEVVIALGMEEMLAVKQIIEECEKSGTRVCVVPFYNDVMPSNPSIEIVGKTKLINLRSSPLDNLGYAVLKRSFDILGSFFLLLLLSPLLITVAIVTGLSSPGPILFKQQRVGRNKRLFTMFKFRSMYVNDKEKTGWSTQADPRQTNFGRFIRKCSIDELPQLLNVLRGDMSLVGPRPEIPFYVEQFKENIPLYMVKHQVRPGMTGWAQVNGYRGDTSIPKRIEHDIWYIEHWSFGLDIRILIRTFLGGFLNRTVKSAHSPSQSKQEAPQSDEKE